MPHLGVWTRCYIWNLTLDVADSMKLFKILFRSVQDLRVLRFLKMARAHVLAANLELSWSDDTLAREDDQSITLTTTTASTLEAEKEEEEAVEQDWEPADDQARRASLPRRH
ncbi:hypothetical protein BGZ88_004312 [Linnemannia elongata]|nr:hypothetical protein BGZ88_004312 [Linnemannia elongata]